jgi:hypothetical protein
MQAQGTLLKPGDIAIIGFQSDNNDQFAFLSLVDIAAGTQIQFSEKGWNASLATPAFVVTTEGVHTWTAPPSGLAKGTTITISFNSLGTGPLATIGSVLSSAAAKLSTSGDELLAFQGTPTAPNFIYAFGSRPWINTGIPSSNQSWLPAPLVNGLTARDFATENDDQYFKHANYEGSKDSILAAIGNTQNWTRSNTRFANFPDWKFQFLLNYYLQPTGNPTIVASWGTELNGTGMIPINFTEKGQVFNFRNRSGIIDLSDNWTTGKLNIDQNLTLAIHDFQLSMEGILDASRGMLLGSEESQIVIRGRSGSLKFDSAAALLNSLHIDSKASVSLSTRLSIVSGKNKGSLFVGDSATIITNNYLVISASEKGESMILPVGTGATISGKVAVEKWIPAGKRNFRFMGHPFANSIALNQLTTDIDITGDAGAVNGFTSTSTNNPSAFWFNAEKADSGLQNIGWTAFTHTNGLANNAWNKQQGIRINLRGKKGEGLNGLAYNPSAVTLHLRDSINFGNQKIRLLKNAHNDGFNLIGNPFAAAIDMSKLILDSNIVPNYYLWNPYLGNKGGYSCYPFSNTVILPSFSAFFAQTIDSTTSNEILFPETCKIVSDNPLRVFGANEKPKNQLELLVEADSVEWDRHLIIFNTKSSDSIDRFDAKKLLNLDLSIFSWSKEKVKLCIDTRSNQLATKIPLGVITSLNKKFNLLVNQFPDLPNYNLYLFDFKNNNKQLLKEGFSYSFNTDSAANSKDSIRFEIQLSLKNSAAVPLQLNSQGLSCFVFPNPTSNRIYLRINTGKKLPLFLSLRNALGQILFKETLEPQQQMMHAIFMKNWAAGMYILVITNGQETITEKIIKY